MRTSCINTFLSAAFSLIFALCGILQANGQEIAVISPLEGTARIIGQQVQVGANTHDGKVQILNDGCSAEAGEKAVTNALQNGAKILIGFPCIEALDNAAQIVHNQTNDAIIITLGVEVTDVVNRKKRDNWPVFRFAPRATAEARSIASYLKDTWRNEDFALIDDGTLYGRQLVEDVRLLLEEDNLKPVFVDNYRPLLENQSGLVRRLDRAGATHVFIGGDAYDVSIIGQNAEALGLPLKIAGGSALRAPPTDGKLPQGTAYIAKKPLSVTINETILSDYEAMTFAAIQIAQNALTYSKENKVSLSVAMRALSFETALGNINFGNDGENTYDWYQVFKVEK